MCRANPAVLAFSAFLCASAGARDYYLSPAGDDADSGARRKPWRTIQKLNRLDFQPGDRILFAGGQTFAGTLELDGKDSGAPARKLVVTSYGAGRAIIDGGNGQAISIDGASHVAVRNLKLRGAGRKSGNTASGLALARAKDLEADHLEVSGFPRCGVAIDGVEGARVTHVHAHENGYSGICSQGAISRNLYVAYCLAENNPGSPAIRKNHSGNGIVVGKAQGAVIEYCEARYNGWDMPWTGNGPVGIWTYESDRVTIQFCVSHHNRSTGQDGGGFDFDGGVTNSVMQYNYSHSNYGAGYLICQYAGAGVFADNVVRYNISQDDGLKDHDAGIYVWVGGALMKSTLVHNNTIFNTKGSAVALAADKRLAGPAPVIAFHNNIFVSRGPQIRGADKGRFTGNLYWSMGERGFQVDDHKDFDAWVAATGQERHGGRIVGRFADPLLRKDGNGLLTDPAKLATLVEYQLLRGSPAIDAGLDLRRLFGIDPGQRDFYGAPLASGGNGDLGAAEAPSPASQIRIAVDAGRPVRTMRGGIGASWHAIEDSKAGRRADGGMLAGSAWGANPPADDARAWTDLTRHADWLGLDWCRVEVEQRMYEPRRREFSWDNSEMRILYRILDWADRRGVDVFLQQMWSGTDWNAYPELRPTLLGRLVSAPLNMDDFAYGLGELIDHLTRVRKYRSIRWLSINNEPGYNWSWWQGPDGKPLPITPGLAAARKELDRRGISLPLSGPDWTDLPDLEPAKIDFDTYIGAYDLHSYFANFDGGKGGYPLSTAEARLGRWAEWAHARNKPLFLSEVGTMVFGWRDRDPGPGSHESGVKDAALVVRGIRAGVDGFNRWSFTNRGDLDGQWQLVDTWDMDAGKLRAKFTPHPNVYYLYGLLSRFTAKGSSVLPVAISPAYGEKERQLVAAALKSPRGRFSLMVVNERNEDVTASFTLAGLERGARLSRHRATRAGRDQAGVAAASFTDTVPGMSVAVYTTYRLKPSAQGVTAEGPR